MKKWIKNLVIKYLKNLKKNKIIQKIININ